VSHQPSWQRLVAWLIAGIIGLQVLADTLPRLVVPISVLAAVFMVLRLVLFHTRKW
jgi:hypothetical protein